MFLDVLANPLRNPEAIKDSLEYMKSRLDREAIINQAVALNPKMLRPDIERRLLQNGVIGENIGLQAFLESKKGRHDALLNDLKAKGKLVESL